MCICTFPWHFELGAIPFQGWPRGNLMPVEFVFFWHSRVSCADVHGEEYCIGFQHTLLLVCADMIQPRKRSAASFWLKQLSHVPSVALSMGWGVAECYIDEVLPECVMYHDELKRKYIKWDSHVHQWFKKVVVLKGRQIVYTTHCSTLLMCGALPPILTGHAVLLGIGGRNEKNTFFIVYRKL